MNRIIYNLAQINEKEFSLLMSVILDFNAVCLTSRPERAENNQAKQTANY